VVTLGVISATYSPAKKGCNRIGGRKKEGGGVTRPAHKISYQKKKKVERSIGKNFKGPRKKTTSRGTNLEQGFGLEIKKAHRKESTTSAEKKKEQKRRTVGQKNKNTPSTREPYKKPSLYDQRGKNKKIIFYSGQGGAKGDGGSKKKTMREKKSVGGKKNRGDAQKKKVKQQLQARGEANPSKTKLAEKQTKKGLQV